MRGVVGQKWRTSGYHCKESVLADYDRNGLGKLGPWVYLVHDVLEGIGAVDGEAHKDEVGLGI